MIVLALAAICLAGVGAGLAAATGPVNDTPPTIAPTPVPQVGQTLTEVNGKWTPAATVYTYQWYRCDAMSMCTLIDGATGQTYTLTEADFGATIIVGELAAGAASAAFSAATPVVLQIGPPAATAPPTIAGGTVGGQTLTETHGTWTNAPTGYNVQWVDCDAAGNACTAIAGATNQTYATTAGDVGHTVRAYESAVNLGGTGTAVASAASAVITPPATPPVNVSVPVASGKAVVGGTLSCTTGMWSGTPPITYSYEWLGDGNTIAGATTSRHKLASTDVAQAIGCSVTATNAAGSATTQSQTLLVTAAPPCFGLSAAAAGKCQAQRTYDRQRATCAKISKKTSAGKKRNAACVAKAKLTFKRAVATAKCQSIKSAHSRAACVAKARKITH